MHLLMVPIHTKRARIFMEQFIETEPTIREINWFNVENRKNEALIDQPQIGGSIKSLFSYDNKEMVHMIVDGKENAIRIANKLKAINDKNESIYAVSLAQL